MDKKPSTHESETKSDSSTFDATKKPGYPPNPIRLIPEEAEAAMRELPETAWEEGEEAARQMGLL